MRNATRVLGLTLLLSTHCTKWIPASADGAAGERYVRVHQASETTTLHSPSRSALRELENDGARLDVRRFDPASTVLLTVAITIGAALMTALVAYVATHPA
jgi:hypothetical protein